MSLPSKAAFKDAKGATIKESFINCGWWFSEDMIPDLLFQIKEGDGYPNERWHTVKLYEVELTYDMASNIYNIEKLRRSIRDAKRFISKFHNIPEYQIKQVYSELIDLGEKLNELIKVKNET